MSANISEKFHEIPVLIVDDEDHLRQISKGFLENYGHFGKITQAENGNDALFKIRNEGFGLVIMDLNMPKMDGLEFLKEMRALPGHGKTAVMVVSGHITEEAFSELLSLNVKAFLTKPFGFSTFIEKLEVALKSIS